MTVTWWPQTPTSSETARSTTRQIDTATVTALTVRFARPSMALVNSEITLGQLTVVVREEPPMTPRHRSANGGTTICSVRGTTIRCSAIGPGNFSD